MTEDNDDANEHAFNYQEGETNANRGNHDQETDGTHTDDLSSHDSEPKVDTEHNSGHLNTALLPKASPSPSGSKRASGHL